MNDSKGNLWVGTDAGYSIYMDNELYRVDEDQGFINNEVQSSEFTVRYYVADSESDDYDTIIKLKQFSK